MGLLESDADRLAMLRALGGVTIQGPRGTFVGILDEPGIAVGDLPVASTAPVLIARTSDLAAAGVVVGSLLRAPEAAYLARAIRPDGSGMADIELELP